jgi:hypothetical protein
VIRETVVESFHANSNTHLSQNSSLSLQIDMILDAIDTQVAISCLGKTWVMLAWSRQTRHTIS